MQNESLTRQAERAENLLSALARQDAELLARELAGARGLSQASRAWRERWAQARPFLHEVALSGWAQGMASALLGGGGQALEERDEAGRTPFLTACFLGDEEMAWALAGAGAQTTARSKLGWGALHWLAAGGRAQAAPLATWLARQGVSLWQPDELGLSAPFLANDASLLAFCQSRAWAEGVRWERLSSTHGESLEEVWAILERQKALRWMQGSRRANGPKASKSPNRGSGLSRAVPAAASLFASAAERFAQGAAQRKTPERPAEGGCPSAVGALVSPAPGEWAGLPIVAAAGAAACSQGGEPMPPAAQADLFVRAQSQREAALRDAFLAQSRPIAFFGAQSRAEPALG